MMAETRALENARDLPARALGAAVAGFLAGQGVGVVPPSQEIPPGPHEHGGLILSFWRFVQPDPDRQPSVAEGRRRCKSCIGRCAIFPASSRTWLRPLSRSPACRLLSEGREEALAAYGAGGPGPDELAPWLEARDLQGTVWLSAMSPLFPDRRSRAEEMLACWRKNGRHLG